MNSLPALPLPMRALFSAFLIVLGTGYLMALTLLFLVEIQPHQLQGQNVVQAISATYHGEPKVSALEAALTGQMSGMAQKEERDRILNWAHAGGGAADFPKVAPIFQSRCAACHSTQSGLPIPPLTSYEEVQKFLHTDVGLTLAQLARVSHVHLLGVSIIFLLTGAIFALAELPTGLKLALLCIPYVSILMDIGSWWGTKFLSPVFAYIVIAGGALMGLALAAQIFISLWQMWSDAFRAWIGKVLNGRPAAGKHSV